MADEKEVSVPASQMEKIKAMLEIELRAKIRAEEEAKRRNPKALGPGPQYKATERCYLNDILFDKDELFVWEGIPAYYMEPMNDEAKAAMKKAGLLDKEGKVRPYGDIVAAGAPIVEKVA